jgi:hypothetical protein
VSKPLSRQQLTEWTVLRTVLLLAAAALWLGLSQTGSGYPGLPRGARAELSRPAAPGSPRELIEKYDCWTSMAPPDMVGKIPRHAVVTIGAGLPMYVGRKRVGLALEHVFEHKHPEITVHAFCR